MIELLAEFATLSGNFLEKVGNGRIWLQFDIMVGWPGPPCGIRNHLCDVLFGEQSPGSLELAEVAIRPPEPSDAVGVGEPNDGSTNFHVDAERKRPHASGIHSGHYGPEQFRVGLAVAGRPDMPAEFGIIDGLVARIHHRGGDEWLNAFRFGMSTGSCTTAFLGNENAGGLGAVPLFGFALALG